MRFVITLELKTGQVYRDTYTDAEFVRRLWEEYRDPALRAEGGYQNVARVTLATYRD